MTINNSFNLIEEAISSISLEVEDREQSIEQIDYLLSNLEKLHEKAFSLMRTTLRYCNKNPDLGDLNFVKNKLSTYLFTYKKDKHLLLSTEFLLRAICVKLNWLDSVTFDNQLYIDDFEDNTIQVDFKNYDLTLLIKESSIPWPGVKVSIFTNKGKTKEIFHHANTVIKYVSNIC